jgi:hypothetical protein
MYVFKYVYWEVTKTLVTRQTGYLKAAVSVVAVHTRYLRLIRFDHVSQLGLDAKTDTVTYCQLQGDLVSVLKCLPIISVFVRGVFH